MTADSVLPFPVPPLSCYPFPALAPRAAAAFGLHLRRSRSARPLSLAFSPPASPPSGAPPSQLSRPCLSPLVPASAPPGSASVLPSQSLPRGSLCSLRRSPVPGAYPGWLGTRRGREGARTKAAQCPTRRDSRGAAFMLMSRGRVACPWPRAPAWRWRGCPLPSRTHASSFRSSSSYSAPSHSSLSPFHSYVT